MAPDVAVVRESFVSESGLASYERLSDYDVTLVAASGYGYDRLPVRHCLSAASVKRDLPKHALQALSSLTLGSSTYMRGLTDTLADFDVVHTVETFHGFSEQAIEAKRKHGCAVVCTVWENIPYFCEAPHYSRTWREQIKHPNAAEIKARVRDEVDLFLPVTRQAAEALRIEGVEDDRIAIVPVGVDAERFRPGRLHESGRDATEFGLAGDDALDVVFVGRYTHSKGVYDLLSAWKRVLRRADRPVHLTMIGGGDEREQVAAYARHIGVSNVTIRGPVPYDDVPLVFDGADLAVLPSVPVRHWQEQYGRVILEAQASGTAVAASETGGIPDAMGDVGELFQPCEPLAMAETIEYLLSDDEYRTMLAQRGRERIESSRLSKHTSAMGRKNIE
jgi:glycosyltransferase involved in cell wall biosynthesis